jgi:lipoprotein-anchoring transpeptidase ErfK/SrfK
MRRLVIRLGLAVSVVVLSAAVVLHDAARAPCGADVLRQSGGDPDPPRRAWLSPSRNGSLNGRTRQAIVAFQGWEGFERNGVPGPATLARLATAARPRPLPGSGRRIEIDLDRQVALLVRGQAVERAIHVSTGASGTPTPTGDFRVYRKERNSWSVAYSVWLPWASYVSGGVALHGYAQVLSISRLTRLRAHSPRGGGDRLRVRPTRSPGTSRALTSSVSRQ